MLREKGKHVIVHNNLSGAIEKEGNFLHLLVSTATVSFYVTLFPITFLYSKLLIDSNYVGTECIFTGLFLSLEKIFDELEHECASIVYELQFHH